MLLVYAAELEEVSVMEAEVLEEVESVTESEVVEEVESVMGSEGREGELEPGNVQEGSPAVAGASADEIAMLRNATSSWTAMQKRLSVPASLPGSSFSMPTARTRLARRRREKRSLPALHQLALCYSDLLGVFGRSPEQFLIKLKCR